MSDKEKPEKSLKSIIKSKIKLDNEQFKSLIRSNVELDREEKGIVRYLSNKEEAFDVKEIIEYLKDHGYQELDKSKAMEALDNLMEVGYVRSKTIGSGSNREERFYLAKGLGGGYRRKKQLQGQGILHDASKLIERLTGSVFLLIGLGFIISQIPNITGAVISSAESVASTVSLAAVLFFIGCALWIGTFRIKK
ncbi:hypothetical protein KAI04_00840 [Candidatus Pacearchaeota archaeon]|nr:hypothetical protein [Candidatus Pacearchaeota archaeon]